MSLIASGALPVRKALTNKVSLDTIMKDGFHALLDPAGTQIKILIDLER